MKGTRIDIKRVMKVRKLIIDRYLDIIITYSIYLTKLKKLKRTTLALILFFFISSFSNGQSYPTPDRLFYEIEPLELKLTFSSKEVKINTNDSTYVDIPLFVLDQKKWDTINVSLRARGNFRRSTCFFPPIRMEIKKKPRKETLFEHYKKTKIVGRVKF